MVVLHAFSDFLNSNFAINNSSPSYYYEGCSPQSTERLKLPRTPISEAIAYGLMQHLAKDDCYAREGKMYGVLLVELPNGEQRILKAFSGLLNGYSVVEGWVPPIPGRDEVALEEARTLAELDAIKQEILTLKQLSDRQQYETLSAEFEQQLQAMSDRHRHCKHQRQEKRQQICNTLTGATLTLALEQLDAESRQQGIERRQLKRQQNLVLHPLQELIAAADVRIRELKQQRKVLSRQLQAQMHAAYSLTNFAGRSRSLQQLMPQGSPTGTGDCCAPKLLHYAAIHHLKPLAMAEFWWGASSVNQVEGGRRQEAGGRRQESGGGRQESGGGRQESGGRRQESGGRRQEAGGRRQESGGRRQEAERSFPPAFLDKIQGEFYGACAERCQPLMGFLLSGLKPISIPNSAADFSRDLENLSLNLSPTRRETLNLPPTLVGKGVRGLGFSSAFPHDLNCQNSAEDTLPIIYEDEWVIAVNKAAGLLSVPGRYHDRQDSVLSRLCNLLPDGMAIAAVHRLDQETSGILLLARDRQTHRQLSQQFQQRQVHKVYEALLSGFVRVEQGTIELPLWGDPENRPYQQVDWQRGKASLTQFQVMAREGDYTRVEFTPLTGRSHQLRVHAADGRGLGITILGDRLYGCCVVTNRLHLHARELCFEHPRSGETLHLQVKTPF
jgi:tRNA pseudouridine32 synthase / 23S rRNA pseudouridine746 synthase